MRQNATRRATHVHGANCRFETSSWEELTITDARTVCPSGLTDCLASGGEQTP